MADEKEKVPDLKDLIVKNKMSTFIGLAIGVLVGISKVPALAPYAEVLNAFAGALGVTLGLLAKDPSK